MFSALCLCAVYSDHCSFNTINWLMVRQNEILGKPITPLNLVALFSYSLSL